MNFSQGVGRSMMVFFSFIVLLLFLRNLPLFYDVGALALIALLIYASGGRIPILKPSRNDIMPAVSSGLILVVLAFYFFKAPYLPDFPSRDLFDHSFSIGGYVNGAIPPAQSQVLYYGIRYILAFIVSITQLPTILGIRYGMAFIAVLSPYVFYDFGMNVFKNHRAAWITSLLYAGSGLWFSMVFNAGLLPNFYSILSALFLISVSIGFLEKKVQASSLFLLFLALTNAFLSHYTILFFLLPLTVFAPLIARRGLVITAAILAPLGIGYFFFRGLVQTLLGFLHGPGAPFADTTLGSIVPPSVLKYLITDLGNDWFFALVIVPCFTAFLYQVIKRPDKMKLFLLITLFFTVGLAPSNFASWRFAYVAEIPLLLITGYTLSLPFQTLKIRSIFQLRVFGLMALIVFPTFLGGWGGTVIGATMIAPSEFHAQQNADYKFVIWSASHLHGSAVTPADISLTFSETRGGIPVYSACSSAIVGWYNPEQISFFAIQKHANFVIVTSGLDCVPPTVGVKVGNGIQNVTLLPMKVITPATLGCPTDCLVYSDPPYIKVFQIST